MLCLYVPAESTRPRVLGVIPARFASTRFPGKALATLKNKPIIQHVYERAKDAELLDGVLIATDDHRIAEAARAFGAPVVMTRADHLSGTDRVAEAASHDEHPMARITSNRQSVVVNIQGDEPLIEATAIDTAVQALLDDPTLVMSTLKRKIDRAEEVASPNVVKVVTNFNGDAIYFSRCPIPFNRGGDHGIDEPYYKHIGLYVYRRDFLLGYSTLPVGPLEKAESLEQLRALENGYRIRVLETTYDSLGVDTPEDLIRVQELLSHHG
jgi:3-deoxy-manno-octulosonate cytidylyltransferase (CMP-KDO synthetase)